MFEIGEIVKVVLTRHLGMIIDIHDGGMFSLTGNDQHKGYKLGYTVRLNDLSIKSFYDFELIGRETNNNVDQAMFKTILSAEKKEDE